MNSVFVDTAYWLALLLEDDDFHAKALAWSDVLNSRLITSTAVLLGMGWLDPRFEIWQATLSIF